MLKNRTLALKWIFFSLVSFICIFALVLTYHYQYSRKIIWKDQVKEARNLTYIQSSRIEAVLSAVQKVTRGLADHLEQTHCSKEEISALIRTTLKNNPEIYGSTVAFEPSAPGSPTGGFAPYFYRRAEKVLYADLAQESYSYRNWDWYRLPKKKQSPFWSEPYFDEGGGNVFMATYSVPFFRIHGKEKQFQGVVTADVSLDGLRDIVQSIQILENGYGFLLSAKGAFITHPSSNLVMKQTLFNVARERGDKDLQELTFKIRQERSGALFFQDFYTRKKCWLTYAPIPSSGWTLAVLFPLEELMADIQHLYRNMVLMALAGLLLFSAAAVFITRLITRPLRAMALATDEIARGNLEQRLPPIRSNDEVGRLAKGFVRMQDSLKTYIKELQETTAAKERIESELSIAREIQQSILPKDFQSFPNQQEFDLFALIEPAREVGGDFYDFFPVDPRRLCLIIADVSGKGVPASLYMAATKTLIKATARQGMTPADTLTRVNQELAAGNESGLFLTVFCGILDLEKGEVTYANAGHPSPIVLRKEGKITPLEATGELVLGALEGIVYRNHQMHLEEGEGLFLFTDGVTEAMNDQGKMFSEERLIEELARNRTNSAAGMVQEVMERVREFSRETPQSDDITMLVLRFFGKKKEGTA
ncbi:MAG: SpoIIE family protein phosphatase [Thermodesulfobacteriota bacterium]